LVYNQLRGILPAEPQVVAGGGALLSSPAWQQIIADALGVPIAISAIREAAARGAALLALEALGVLSDIGQVPLEIVGAVVMPNPDNHRRYQGALERQQQLYVQLAADR
jgi:gluconokinase